MRKAISLSIVMVLALCLVLVPSYAFDRAQVLTLEEFEEFELKVNGLELGNFSILEEKAWLAKGLTNITVSSSARNRSEVSIHFVYMVIGFDKEGVPLWAMELGPSFSTLSAKKTTSVQKSTYVPPGTLKRTHSYWIRVVGGI